MVFIRSHSSYTAMVNQRAVSMPSNISLLGDSEPGLNSRSHKPVRESTNILIPWVYRKKSPTPDTTHKEKKKKIYNCCKLSWSDQFVIVFRVGRSFARYYLFYSFSVLHLLLSIYVCLLLILFSLAAHVHSTICCATHNYVSEHSYQLVLFCFLKKYSI